MSKIKIVYVLDAITNITAGSERQLSQLVTHLDRERFEPHLMVLHRSDWLESEYFPCDRNSLDMESVLSLSGYNKTLELRDFIADNEFHVVQTFFPAANVVGVLAAYKAGCRIIISTRRNTGFWYTRKTLFATRYANRYVSRFLANSEVVARITAIKEGIDKERCAVIYNGLDPGRFRVDEEQVAQARAFMGADKDSMVVGIVANLRPVKDIESFIRAAALISGKRGDVRFVVIGSGEDRMAQDLQKLSESLGLGERLRFMGSIENPVPFIKNFDVGILSSKSEGLSNTLLEYGALGIPAVATDTGGNPEIVQDQKTGYLVPVGEPEKIAEAAIRLLEDKSLRDSMGQSGFKSVWSKFNLPVCIKLHQALYTRLYDDVALGSPQSKKA
jgi:glycosyltransferase involved in cell wall biosynthesis